MVLAWVSLLLPVPTKVCPFLHNNIPNEAPWPHSTNQKFSFIGEVNIIHVEVTLYLHADELIKLRSVSLGTDPLSKPQPSNFFYPPGTTT